MNTSDPSDVLGPLREQTPPAPVVPQTAVHPRDDAMQAAGGELLGFFTQWQAKYALTPFEYQYLIVILLRGLLQGLCIVERESPR
jgi:hypothetical protein